MGQAPIALSLGEPAGIGPDLLLALYNQRQSLNLPPFAVYGDPAFLSARARRLGLNLALAEVDAEEAAARFVDALPVVPLETAPIADRPGHLDPAAAPAVLESIAQATGDCLAGVCRALVTPPIHKGNLYQAGFPHPGHTEYLAALCAGGGAPPTPVMMLAFGPYRAVPATIHLPLREVPDLITTQLLVRLGRIVARDLRQHFGMPAPKIAFSGLNPHAGEGGAMGREDIEQIAPAVALLNKEGIAATGPLPADTLFHPPHWAAYDAVIAMYHDQALIPVKTLGFDEAVNVTLGLPIVRTSPDHGTALDLAGTGRASPNSLLAAIRLADEMSAQ